MKYLKDYTEDKLTALFNKTNTIFAFSMKQFNEQKKKGIKYVNMGMGMLTDKRYVEKLRGGLDKIYKDGMAQDIKENGLEKIILRELANHEAYYTGEIDDTFEAIKSYGVTKEQIWKMYHNKNATLTL
jgi:hypothetical protein|tara:strand:- start:3636 stop:4019 length:384 start_codon:yes stop_codon:yes gene_type:complete